MNHVLMIDVLVAASVGTAVCYLPWSLRRPATGGGRAARWSPGPGVALALVVCLIYLNQVLFNVYVIRVQDGSASFIGRYLPAGWFDLATGSSAIQVIARHFPAPEMLSVTVLRVQAFWELPFVVLAYLTVLRWLDRRLYRQMATLRFVFPAAVSYTVVFCVVEWDLRNPFTVDDILVRLCSAVVTPLGVAWLARRDRGEPGPMTAAGLLRFAASAGALGYLVLVVYDSALLYNLGHVAHALPGALVALLALGAARASGVLLPASALPGAAVTAVAFGLRWSLALFMVPALAVRYGVTFGTPLLAALAGLAVVVAAAICSVLDLAGLFGRTALRTVAARLVPAAAVGLSAAYVTVGWSTDTYYEAAVLRGAAAFCLTVIIACGLLDRWGQRSARNHAS